jgi:SAM-dependent methyltransferase
MTRMELAVNDLERLRRVIPGVLGIDEAKGLLHLRDGDVPIVGGVYRFRQEDGYNSSFALQWNRFKTNQLDDVNGTDLTRRRFAESGWSLGDLAGDLILEAGCGPGRFTRLLAESGAEVVAFDYSNAVDANATNHGHLNNLTLLQADIFQMPFQDGAFDRVFCHGVLQHTPDPEAAFERLHEKVRPGGLISVDVYLKDGKIRPYKSKYLWRPLATRMRPEKLLAFLEWFIPKWLPIDTLIKRIPVLGNYLGAIIPCWNYFYTDLSKEQKVQWAIMDTFDALAPTYDNPVTMEEVRGWFRRLGYSDFEVREGGNGVVGNGRKLQ